jgi:hypothetical protein
MPVEGADCLCRDCLRKAAQTQSTSVTHDLAPHLVAPQAAA